MHGSPAWLSSPFGVPRVRRHRLPGGSVGCHIAVCLSPLRTLGPSHPRTLGVALQKLTHLLFPEDPEVVELSDQGVGAAGCGREK